jgi:hypothetical protein
MHKALRRLEKFVLSSRKADSRPFTTIGRLYAGPPLKNNAISLVFTVVSLTCLRNPFLEAKGRT